jgi:hypothetical protein
MALMSAAHSSTFSLVVESGDAAPGGASQRTFESFGAPLLNDVGQTAFSGTIFEQGAAINGRAGIFTVSNGAPEVVAAVGDAVPGDRDLTYGDFGDISINTGGQVVFGATVRRAGDAESAGIFTRSGARALSGDAPAGVPDVRFDSFTDVSLNETGAVAFRATLRNNDPNPGPDPDGRGIFVDDTLVVRQGDPVPGGGGLTYTTLQEGLGFNDAGEVAFRASLPGFVDPNGDNILVSNGGIFTSTGRTVARVGGAVDGLDGLRYQRFSGDVALNNDGETAFVAQITGPGVDPGNDTVLVGPSGVLARQGGMAPVADGALFTGFEGTTAVSLNDAGQTAFMGFLDRRLTSGTVGSTPIGNTAIFLSDRAGPLTTIVRSGQQIDFGNGDLRTVSNLSFSQEGLNASGQLAFLAFFTDGSAGLVIYDPHDATAVVPLPAPMMLLLGGLGGLWLVGRRRSAQG